MPFSISKLTESLFIYGAGKLGKDCARKMMARGFKISGFLDKNAHVINNSYSSIPVFHPNHIKGFDATIIICLHNALWHEDAVTLLQTLGQNKILFLPVSGTHDHIQMQNMLDLYNYFECEKYDKLINIPTLTELDTTGIKPFSAVIEENNSFLTLWVDITSLYTSLQEIDDVDGIFSYCNTPMPGMKPYVLLFQHLGGGGWHHHPSFSNS